MKKLWWTMLVAVMVAAGTKARAQADELAQLALNIEKLAQFKQILSDLKSGYQIISKGYGTVKDISEGNFKLHKTFLDGLYAVSPQVRKYRRVAEIIQYQLVLVREFRAANAHFARADLLNENELKYLAAIYQRLFEASLRNLEELTMIVTAGQLRMSDDERLKAIDGIHADIQDKVMFLRWFNNQAKGLVLQRERERTDMQNLKGLHGIR
ncbi:P-loop NTPase family protein [Pedobacter chitinilyticus]|uniref:TerB family tellurite resistance protein n=1 Tax=Pedobacter chitinilyticus TaxID=2233776 RepID=A0A3S3PHB4_9SPHI|nr:TerB family tellurite resistance protein [Pedobacter chitinilyticus]RWU08130.1 TerB family tellurite resistance protein [Pedobacter chitinilyticus]